MLPYSDRKFVKHVSQLFSKNQLMDPVLNKKNLFENLNTKETISWVSFLRINKLKFGDLIEQRIQVVIFLKSRAKFRILKIIHEIFLGRNNFIKFNKIRKIQL